MKVDLQAHIQLLYVYVVLSRYRLVQNTMQSIELIANSAE